MKTSTYRPSTISTNQKNSTRSRPSIDDDFAPSVTPSSAGSDFPRLHKYHAPKDKTWWPNQNPIMSSEPADPTLPKAPRKNSDATFRPRRSLRGSSSGSTGIKAASEALKNVTRSGGVRKYSTKRSAPLVLDHRGPTKSATGKHCATTGNPKRRNASASDWKEPDYTSAGVEMNLGGGTTKTLTALESPRSPKNRKFSASRASSNGDPRWTETGFASLQRRPSAVDSLERINAAETRNSFERRHGNGERLGSLGSGGLLTPPATPTTGSKRRANFNGGDHPVKRLRNNVSNLTDDQIEAASEECTRLIAQLGSHPSMLQLEDVGLFFNHINLNIATFADTRFKFKLDGIQRANWPLHQLSGKYLPLMLVTQYIADGSQYGWRQFFTAPASRSALVQGIIGEWLKQRLFNHTCFGLTDKQLLDLEDMDRQYLHHDGFLRSKKRGKMVEKFLLKNDGTVLRKATVDLTNELITVLEPLLPGFCGELDSSDRGDAMQHIRFDIETIIAMAANLHHGIRVLGKNGTIIRVVNAVQKGDQYHETAPFEIVNDEMVQRTRHHAGSDSKLKIKMTTFPRVEAYVPHGPDYSQMVSREHRERKKLQSGGEDFSWDTLQESMNFWPALPADVLREQTRKHGNLSEKAKYGSYVTVYPRLTRHQVYCEWAPAGDGKKVKFTNTKDGGKELVEVDGSSDDEGKNEELTHEQRSADRKYGIPQHKDHRLTLRQAVNQARTQNGIVSNVEDTLKGIWSWTCGFEPLFESAVLAWLLFTWHRGVEVPGYQMLREMKLDTKEGWRVLGSVGQEKVKGLLMTLMGGVKGVGRQGRVVTKNVVREVKKAKATSTVHGVIPGRYSVMFRSGMKLIARYTSHLFLIISSVFSIIHLSLPCINHQNHHHFPTLHPSCHAVVPATPQSAHPTQSYHFSSDDAPRKTLSATHYTAFHASFPLIAVSSISPFQTVGLTRFLPLESVAFHRVDVAAGWASSLDPKMVLDPILEQQVDPIRNRHRRGSRIARCRDLDGGQGGDYVLGLCTRSRIYSLDNRILLALPRTIPPPRRMLVVRNLSQRAKGQIFCRRHSIAGLCLV